MEKRKLSYLLMLPASSVGSSLRKNPGIVMIPVILLAILPLFLDIHLGEMIFLSAVLVLLLGVIIGMLLEKIGL